MYLLPLRKFKTSPSTVKSLLAASSCPGVSEIKRDLDGSGKEAVAKREFAKEGLVLNFISGSR